MKKFTISIACMFLLSTNFSFNASATDLCKELAENPEVEDYFIENMKTKMDLAGKHYYASGGGGSCGSFNIHYKPEDKKDSDEYGEYVEYLCHENGCGMGTEDKLISWNNEIYIISQEYSSFEETSGWSKLSKKEQARIKFRNLTSTIYHLSKGATSAELVCDYKKYVSEKLISGNKTCLSFMNGTLRNILDHKKTEQQIRLDEYSPPVRMDSYYVDLGNKVTVRSQNDDELFTIAPGQGSSGAGCGCGASSIILINGDKPLTYEEANDTQKIIIRNIKKVEKQMNCDDELTIVTDNLHYFLEKKNNILGSRELYELYSESEQPTCSFINYAPLAYYNVNDF